MYTINTQLAHFKYSLNSKRLILNVKWFKVDKFNTLSIHGISFNRLDLEKFIGFMDQNSQNFPGSFFIDENKKEEFDVLIDNDLSVTFLPLYLVLSKNRKLHFDNTIYNTTMIQLIDTNECTVDYTLEFDVVGKIEIYKEDKRQN